jgi:hypothetical protein
MILIQEYSLRNLGISYLKKNLILCLTARRALDYSDQGHVIGIEKSVN